jgi:hypothetical protein
MEKATRVRKDLGFGPYREKWGGKQAAAAAAAAAATATTTTTTTTTTHFTNQGR